MSPFEGTYRDGRSAASLIAELAAGRPYDYILSYEQIAEALGIDPDDINRLRGGVQRAKSLLQRQHHRALEAVPLKGYRIIRPGEHAGIAMHHRRKSDRQIRKAIAVVTAADERDMSPTELDRNRQVGLALMLLHERQRDVETRVSRIESLIEHGSAPKIIPGVLVPPAIEAPEESSGE